MLIRRLETGELGVEGAFDGKPAAVEDMGVDHRCLNILVTEEFLHGADIITILEEMSGKGMAEGVRRNRFFYFCTLSCIPYGPL